MNKANKGERLFAGNALHIGQRLVGYSLWNYDRGEYLMASEREIGQMIQSGQKVCGFKLRADGKKAELEEYMNIVKVSGLMQTPIWPITGIVNELYTLVNKSDKGYELLNMRYGRKVYSQIQIESMLGLGAHINGIFKKPDGGFTTWFDINEPARPEPVIADNDGGFKAMYEGAGEVAGDVGGAGEVPKPESEADGADGAGEVASPESEADGAGEVPTPEGEADGEPVSEDKPQTAPDDVIPFGELNHDGGNVFEQLPPAGKKGGSKAGITKGGKK